MILTPYVIKGLLQPYETPNPGVLHQAIPVEFFSRAWWWPRRARRVAIALVIVVLFVHIPGLTRIRRLRWWYR
jgi:hypothetical protein